MRKTLQIANIIALVITIIMNYLSNTGIFNDSTMATVSAKYQNLFTPAGYAFSIWGIIYLFLIGFVIHQSRGLFSNKETPVVVEKIGWLFVLSCVANCLWIVAWLYDYTGASVIIMAILLFSLWRIIVRTRMELDLISFKKIALECWPFAIYFGWITVAIIANIAAFLTKINWDGFGFSDETWAVIMIIAAGIIHLLITWTRNLRESSSVGIWALIAVAVANWDQHQPVANAAIIVSAIIFVSTAIHGYKNRGNAFTM